MKPIKQLLMPVLCALALAATIGTGSAAEPAAQPEAKAKFRPFNGKLKAVDKAGGTITLEGEKAQTFQIIAETKIQKEGKAGTLEDLAAGDYVGGRAREAAAGKWEVLTLNAGAKAVRAAKEKPEKKPASK